MVSVYRAFYQTGMYALSLRPVIASSRFAKAQGQRLDFCTIELVRRLEPRVSNLYKIVRECLALAAGTSPSIRRIAIGKN
jgi:hypothetical protein